MQRDAYLYTRQSTCIETDDINTSVFIFGRNYWLFFLSVCKVVFTPGEGESKSDFV